MTTAEPSYRSNRSQVPSSTATTSWESAQLVEYTDNSNLSWKSKLCHARITYPLSGKITRERLARTVSQTQLSQLDTISEFIGHSDMFEREISSFFRQGYDIILSWLVRCRTNEGFVHRVSADLLAKMAIYDPHRIQTLFRRDLALPAEFCWVQERKRKSRKQDKSTEKSYDQRQTSLDLPTDHENQKIRDSLLTAPNISELLLTLCPSQQVFPNIDNPQALVKGLRTLITSANVDLNASTTIVNKALDTLTDNEVIRLIESHPVVRKSKAMNHLESRHGQLTVENSMVDVKAAVRQSLREEPSVNSMLDFFDALEALVYESPGLDTLEETDEKVKEAVGSVMMGDKESKEVKKEVGAATLTNATNKAPEAASAVAKIASVLPSVPLRSLTSTTEELLVGLKAEVLVQEIAEHARGDPELAEKIVDAGGMTFLRFAYDQFNKKMEEDEKGLDLKNHTVSEFYTDLARAVANLAYTSKGRSEAVKAGWPLILKSWTYRSKPNWGVLQAESFRALLNMYPYTRSDAVSRGPLYMEGLYVLKPVHPKAVPAVDVIFLHGLRGGPIITWRCQVHGSENEATIWPRDWLGRDFPDARILSVGFDTRFSGWTGRNLHLVDQAEEILFMLDLADVGSQPFMFVVHSYGGLLAKQILSLAQNANRSKFARAPRLVDKFSGIVFYGTPHRGASFASKFSGAFFENTLKPSGAVSALFPGTKKLDELDKNFRNLVRSKRMEDSVISYAEGRGTSIAKVGGTHFSTYLVPPDTAHAGIGSFEVISGANHIEICKPRSRSDIRYRQLVLLLSRIREKDEQRNKAKS
mmetsp:Transcript_1974/g.3505  ORF Transcript_1974/g.3505 Transcript_1974/m.3505 type:complete len:814 (-) Transcript_1974:775-3216(-)